MSDLLTSAAATALASPAAIAAAGAPVGRTPGRLAAQWFMDYRNADGSVAEMCGNGVRVFARYLVEHGLAHGPEFAIETRAGTRQVRMEPDGQVTVDMGPASVLGPGRAEVGGLTRDGVRISVGNPHLACMVDAPVDDDDLAAPPELDPALFPDGANVELVRLTGERSAQMSVYERGSGPTRSCGTGAVAAAVAAAGATGERDGAWAIRVPGGDLTVTLAPQTTLLTGPAVIVAEGQLTPAWLASHPPRRLTDRAGLPGPVPPFRGPPVSRACPYFLSHCHGRPHTRRRDSRPADPGPRCSENSVTRARPGSHRAREARERWSFRECNAREDCG